MTKYVDLHTHLRGTITPNLLKELAKKNRVSIDYDRLIDDEEKFVFTDFQDFLKKYDLIGSVVRHASDLQMLAYNYLGRVAKQGTIYVEFMHSPDHSLQNGIGLEAQFDAISAGIEQARQEFGIAATVIATAVRHGGPVKALELAEQLSSLSHPIVRGFGLTGNELAFDIHEFSGAFYVARQSGLMCTAHVGEWGNAASIEEAISALALNRIGHGIRAVEDIETLERLANSSIAFEVCLTSNFILKKIPFAEHPCKILFDSGCTVTLATDDPGYFQTTPHIEYKIASENFDLSQNKIEKITLDAISSAFCSEAEKLKLKESLKQTIAPPF